MKSTVELPVLRVERPLECRIAGRINRFVVRVILQEGDFRACINNTGRLGEFLIQGRKGYCTRNEKPGRTDYRLFAIEESSLGAVIDTGMQMRSFESSLIMGLLPWLTGFRIFKRNARLGSSLIDYLLEGDEGTIYLEVKSAVLRKDGYAMYPDCPSLRGRRHIRELTSHVRAGGKAVILFIAALPDVAAFKPNRAGDPEIGKLLVEAKEAGVEVRAIGMAYHPQDSCIYLYDANLKVELS